MLKYLIKENINNNYDKIFDIIDKHSFFRINTENEYMTDEGYVLEFNEVPFEARERILNLKGVEEK